MRHVSLLLIFILSVCISGVTWVASCERCYEKVADGKNLCAECKLSTSSRLADMKTREVRITNVITSAMGKLQERIRGINPILHGYWEPFETEKSKKRIKGTE